MFLAPSALWNYFLIGVLCGWMLICWFHVDLSNSQQKSSLLLKRGFSKPKLLIRQMPSIDTMATWRGRLLLTAKYESRYLAIQLSIILVLIRHLCEIYFSDYMILWQISNRQWTPYQPYTSTCTYVRVK